VRAADRRGVPRGDRCHAQINKGWLCARDLEVRDLRDESRVLRGCYPTKGPEGLIWPSSGDEPEPPTPPPSGLRGGGDSGEDSDPDPRGPRIVAHEVLTGSARVVVERLKVATEKASTREVDVETISDDSARGDPNPNVEVDEFDNTSEEEMARKRAGPSKPLKRARERSRKDGSGPFRPPTPSIEQEVDMAIEGEVSPLQAPAVVGLPLAQEDETVLGWFRCRVVLLKSRPPQCFKCLAMGHVQQRCPCPTDRARCCFNCGQPGHEVAACRNRPHCPPCAGSGLKAIHRPGGTGYTPVNPRREPSELPTSPTPYAGGEGAQRNWCRWRLGAGPFLG